MPNRHTKLFPVRIPCPHEQIVAGGGEQIIAGEQIAICVRWLPAGEKYPGRVYFDLQYTLWGYIMSETEEESL